MDMDGIEELIDTSGQAIYGFCRHLANNKEDTDDLYQQAFLKAVELRHKIDITKNPKSFLISLVIGIWKNKKKKYATRMRIAPAYNNTDDDEAFLNIPSGDPDVEETALAGEMRIRLRLIINTLDDTYRLPLILHYFFDMKVSEIAAALKKPEGTVKRRLHEARKKIKKELEETGYV